MIVKSFELKNYLKKNFFLLHGHNDGHKETIINDLFKTNYKDNIYLYF